MSRLNTALVWFLLLAVPMQGYAVASMICCGSGHGRSLSSAELDLHAASHEHALADHHHDANRAAADAHDATGPDSAGIQSSGCSACAGCSVGAALVEFNGNLFLADLAIERISQALLPYFGFVTGGPQRPPRPPFA